MELDLGRYLFLLGLYTILKFQMPQMKQQNDNKGVCVLRCWVWGGTDTYVLAAHHGASEQQLLLCGGSAG